MASLQRPPGGTTGSSPLCHPVDKRQLAPWGGCPPVALWTAAGTMFVGYRQDGYIYLWCGCYLNQWSNPMYFSVSLSIQRYPRHPKVYMMIFLFHMALTWMVLYISMDTTRIVALLYENIMMIFLFVLYGTHLG